MSQTLYIKKWFVLDQWCHPGLRFSIAFYLKFLNKIIWFQIHTHLKFQKYQTDLKFYLIGGRRIKKIKIIISISISTLASHNTTIFEFRCFKIMRENIQTKHFQNYEFLFEIIHWCQEIYKEYIFHFLVNWLKLVSKFFPSEIFNALGNRLHATKCISNLPEIHHVWSTSTSSSRTVAYQKIWQTYNC